MKFHNSMECMLYEDAVDIFRALAPHADIGSMTELTKAYKKLQFQFHPDRGGDVEISKNINVAYGILKLHTLRSTKKIKQTTRRNSDRVPEWAWAGWNTATGPSCPPDSWHTMRMQDYSDLAYIKKHIWELAMKKSQEKEVWTMRQFGIHYRTNFFHVYGHYDVISEMTKAMLEWIKSDHANTEALFACSPSGKYYLVWHRGKTLEEPLETKIKDTASAIAIAIYLSKLSAS